MNDVYTDKERATYATTLIPSYVAKVKRAEASGDVKGAVEKIKELIGLKKYIKLLEG